MIGRKLTSWIGIAVILALLVPALRGSRAAAQPDRPLIVASFGILADVARNVAGDAADVETLIPASADPHTYAPSPQDIVLLSDADAVLVVGMGFEQGLGDVLAEAAGDRITVVSQCVPVRLIPVGVVHDHSTDADSPEPDGDTPDDLTATCADHDAELETVFADVDLAPRGVLGPLHATDCDEGGCDPHVWTDPVNAAWWTLAIRDTLIALDPDDAEVYDANARAYLDDLAALHIDITALIEAVPEANRVLVTNHVVFNYFAARYDLTPVGVVIPGGSTSAEPSVQDVFELVQAISDLGVGVIFTDSAASDDLAQQIADEAGIETLPLLTGTLGEPGSDADSYLSYMRANAAAIAGALAGE